MKAIRMMFTLLFMLSAAVFQLPAQQSEADRKLFEKIKAKAEKGDAQSQFTLGAAFFGGNLGVVKDEVGDVDVDVKISRNRPEPRPTETTR